MYNKDFYLRSLWDNIVNNTSGGDGKSGGDYIDFPNGECIDMRDIKEWLREYSDLDYEIDQINDQDLPQEEIEKQILRYVEDAGYDDQILDLYYQLKNERYFTLYKARQVEEKDAECEYSLKR